ncbi:hypothetical protein ACTNDY_07125 [Tissierellaceae bacterium HCP3S3_D8]
MVKIYSKDVLSHNLDEWTDYEDLEKGIKLMLNSISELSME